MQVQRSLPAEANVAGHECSARQSSCAGSQGHATTQPRRAWLTLATLVFKLGVLLQLLQKTVLHVLQLRPAQQLLSLFDSSNDSSFVSPADSQYLLWRSSSAAAALVAPVSTNRDAVFAPSVASAAGAGSAMWHAVAAWAFAHPCPAALLAMAAAWLCVEVAFQLLWLRPRYRAWNKLCSSMMGPAGLTVDEGAKLFRRFIRISEESPCDQEFLEAYLSKWFMGASVAEIHRGNMEELFAYGFHYKTRQQMDEAGVGHLPAQMTSQFESVFKVKFKPGYNSSLKFMGHLWEDLQVHSRPLLFYIFTELLGRLADVVMRLMGFTKQQEGPLHYYIKNMPAAGGETSGQQQQQQQPIVFIHGVVGLVLYLPLVARLRAGGAPLLVLDIKHVGMRLCRRIPSIDSLTHALAAAMQRHGLPPSLIMAHSYGTLVASRLLRLHKHTVGRMLLVDPVCMAMFMPRLLHGFVYASLRLQITRPLAAVQQLMLWLVAKDLHLAATFARGFFWTDLNLWPEELPAGSTVVLGECDALVQAPEVASLLASNASVKVILKPGLIHGGFLLDHNVRHAVIAEATAVMAAAAAATTVTAAAAAREVSAEAACTAVAAVGSAVADAACLAVHDPQDLAAAQATPQAAAATTAGGSDITNSSSPASQAVVYRHGRGISCDSACSLAFFKAYPEGSEQDGAGVAARQALPAVLASCEACQSCINYEGDSGTFGTWQPAAARGCAGSRHVTFDSVGSLAEAVLCSCRCVEWGGPVTGAAAAVDAAVALSAGGCRKEFDQELQQQNRAGASIARELQPVLS